MKKKMETTRGTLENQGSILWVIQGLYRENGKENEDYYLGFRV